MKLSKRLESCLIGYNLICVALLMIGCVKINWQQKLETELSEFGHRNWIIVADAAYPKQSASGIETIVTAEEQLEVLTVVLNKIEESKHVRAVVFLDDELEAVPEEDAPGIDAYRSKLKGLLKDSPVHVMPHEQIIGKLDEASRLFNILILKTTMTLPYTSVFLQLDCGYWTEEKEKKLRNHVEANPIGDNL
jgi:D-ribose pyranose/furanose isomerase RbsD